MDSKWRALLDCYPTNPRGYFDIDLRDALPSLSEVRVAIGPVWSGEANWWWVQPPVWIATLAMVAATFALGLAFRARPVPRALTWLGLVSYSVYLLHHPLLRYVVAIVGDVRRSPLIVQLPLATGYVAGVLVLSWLTYRFIESPMQVLGRRIGRRVAQRGAGPTRVETVTT